jgi:microcystin-dependent protein
MGFNFAPQGWAMCNGQFLPIAQNQALFSLLGTTYGGNGQTTFALPDLRGRSPFHFGQGHTLGERAGEAAHTLTISELPLHTHTPQGSNTSGNLVPPATPGVNGQHNIWAVSTQNPYASAPNAAMDVGGTAPTGGSQAHENMQPYLVLNFCIALIGIFPSQN